MLKGFKCPSWGEEPGRNNSLSYCLNKCSKPCVAPNVLEAIYSLDKDNPHKGKIISVSQLTGGCKRKTVLERTKDYYVEPDLKLPTFRGTLIHSVIEQSKTARLKRNKWLVEHHMELPVTTDSGDWILSGTLDAYDPKRATIFDTKTLQDYAIEKMVKGNEHGTWSDHISDSYVKQQNLYRYMGKRLGLFDAKRLRLQVVAFGRLILTGTDVTLSTYKKGVGKIVSTHYLPDIPIVDDEEVESWIQDEGDAWYRILFGGEKPPVVSEAYSWLCKRCPFFETEECPDPAAERELGFTV